MYILSWLWGLLIITLIISSVTTIEFTDDVIRQYREKVRDMFYHAYNGYLEHAFPLDELKPISCTGQDTWGSFSLSLVDALDTLLVMGNTTEFQRAVDLVLKSVRVDANVNVSVFETNIRVVGGLLSAHMLSGRVKDMPKEDHWPCSGPLLRLAEAMAARLLPAFNTETGMPFGSVNLKYGVHKSETPVTCTAGVGTYVVEFGALSRLTGDPRYEKAALRALEGLWKTRSPIGLVGNHINVQTGQWTATDSGIGAGVDSYFEYLVKGALLLQRPALMEQFYEYVKVINKHVRREDWFMWVTMQKGAVSLPIFQSLEAFWPGLLTMVGDLEDATRIMMQYSQVISQYGFPPEFFNIPNAEPMDKRSAYPLRPEMAESLMYLYRATDDPTFLEIGAQLVDAIEHSAKTKCGYATINNVNDHSIEDRMESFFLAETTKYLYLLFDPQNFIHNDGSRAEAVEVPGRGSCMVGTSYIFNTEAHPIDPGIVYCCSEQAEMENEVIQNWEDDIDFSALLESNTFSKKQRELPKIFKAHVEDSTSDENNYIKNQYGTDEIEFEVDENMKNDSGTDSKSETSESEEENEEKEDDNETENEPHVPAPAVRVKPIIRHVPKGTAEDRDRRIREIVQMAHVLDEQRREKGETAGIAEKLIDVLSKMREEEKTGKRRSLSDLSVDELKERLAVRHRLSMVPVPMLPCLNCCYPLEELGDSEDFRYFLGAINEAIYRNNAISFDMGPLCWSHEAPREEDSYNSALPILANMTLEGDFPLTAYSHTPSFTSFQFADVSDIQFRLLTTAPLPFSFKFVGLGQVAPKRNESLFYN